MSVFDLDRTLIRTNSSFSFGQYLYRKKLLTAAKALQYASCYCLFPLGLLNIKQVQEILFRKLFFHQDAFAYAKLAKDFVLDMAPKLIYKPAVHYLNSAKQQGQQTIILSSGPDFLVKCFAEYFGVDAWAATVYSTDSNHRFSAIGPWMLPQDKKRCIETLTDVSKKNITAFSDSFHDLPFLKAAGKAIAVNPDRRLRQFARKQVWQII